MFDVSQRHMQLLFFGVVIGLFGFWIFLVVKHNAGNAATASTTFATLIQAEAAILTLLLATLTIAVALVSSLARRLDDLRERLMPQLQDVAVGDELRLIADQYQAATESGSGLSPEFVAVSVRHFPDRSIGPALRQLATVSDAASGQSNTQVGFYPLSGLSAPRVTSDSEEFFRSVCRIFLAPAYAFRHPKEPLDAFAREVREINGVHDVVGIVNTIYDLRQATQRGLPLFSFLVAVALAFSMIGLSTDNPDYAKWIARVSIGLMFFIVMLFGYYVIQITGRYFQQRRW